MLRSRQALAVALLLLQVCSHAVCVHGAMRRSHTRGDRHNRKLYEPLPLNEAREKIRTTCPAPVPYHLAKDGDSALDLRPATLSFLQETSRARTELFGAGALPSWTCLSLAGGLTSFAMSPVFMVAMNSYFIYDQVNIMRNRYNTFREHMESVEDKLSITAEEEAKEATGQLLREVSNRLDRIKSDIESIQRTESDIIGFIKTQKSPHEKSGHNRLFDDGLEECYREADKSLEELNQLVIGSEARIGSLPYEVLVRLGDIRDLPVSIGNGIFHAKDAYMQLEQLFEGTLSEVLGLVDEAKASVGPALDALESVEIKYSEKIGVRPAKSIEYSAASVLTQRIEELQQDTIEASSSGAFLMCNFNTKGIIEEMQDSESDGSSSDDSIDDRDGSPFRVGDVVSEIGGARVVQSESVDPCLRKASVQDTLSEITAAMNEIMKNRRLNADDIMDLLAKVEHAERAAYALKEVVANIVEIIGTKNHRLAPYGAIKDLGSFCRTLKLMASSAITRFSKPPRRGSEMDNRADEMLAAWSEQSEMVFNAAKPEALRNYAGDDLESMSERLNVLESSIYTSTELHKKGYRTARQVYEEGRSIMLKIDALSTMGTRPSDGDYKQLRESLETDLRDFLEDPEDEERGKLFKGLNSLKESVRKLADQCSARIDHILFRKDMDTPGTALTVMAEQLEKLFERSVCVLLYDRLKHELRSVGDGDPMDSTVEKVNLFKEMVNDACPHARSRLDTNPKMREAMRKVEAAGTLAHRLGKSDYLLVRMAGSVVWGLGWTVETVQYLLGTNLYSVQLGLSYFRTTIEGLAYAMSPEALGSLSMSCDGTSAASGFLLALTYTLDQAVLHTMTISDCDTAAHMLLNTREVHDMKVPPKSILDP